MPCGCRRARRRRRGRGSFCGGEHHALEAADVEHVNLERDAARLLEALGAVAAHEAEQRVDAAHAGPGHGPLEQRASEAADGLAVLGSLALEAVGIAQRVSALVRREVARVDGAAAGRLPRVGLHERAAVVEAQERAVVAGAQLLADEARRQRVERLLDLGEMITADLRLAPSTGGCRPLFRVSLLETTCNESRELRGPADALDAEANAAAARAPLAVRV